MNNYSFEIQKICCTVENYFNFPEGAIQIKTRKREVATARQIAMYFSRKLTKASLEYIGLQIGHKDHATVLHACKTVNNLIETDKQFRFDINELSKKITVDIITKEEITDAISQALIKRFAKVIKWKNIYKAML